MITANAVTVLTVICNCYIRQYDCSTRINGSFAIDQFTVNENIYEC